MVQALKILTLTFLAKLATSVDIVYKDGDEKFREFLEEVYRKIQVDEGIKATIEERVVQDLTKILAQVASDEPCFAFKLQRKGSSFEELKVGYPDEFDFGLLNEDWTGKTTLKRDQNTPDGFGYANQTKGNCLDTFLFPNQPTGSRHVDPSRVRGRLRTLVNQAFTKLDLRKHIVRDPWEGGPAVTFEFKSEYKDFKEISIDLAIAIDLLIWPQGARIIPDLNGARMQLVPRVRPAPDQQLWQISSSLVEKEIMLKIDEKDCGCRKKVLKLAKYFRMRTMGRWFSLASYHLKTAMLHLNAQYKNPGDWSQANLVPRFKNLIDKILTHLKSGSLPSFFFSGNNLFAGKPDLPSVVTAVEDFLRVLRQNPDSLRPPSPSKLHKALFRDTRELRYKIFI